MTIAAAVTSATAILHYATGPHGLALTIWQSGQSIAAGVDHELTRRSVRDLAAGTGRSAHLRWDGFVYAAESREYRLRVACDGLVRLWIDGRRVFENAGSVDAPPSALPMSVGAHALTIEYQPAARPARFELQWDFGNPYRLTAVPIEALSPRPLSRDMWRGRAAERALAVIVCGVWACILLVLLSLPVWRAAGRDLSWTRPLILVFALMGGLFVVGVWWGAFTGWAPDEVIPAGVIEAMQQGFAHGWYDKYPPMQYYLLAVMSAPTLAADRLHWLSMYTPLPYFGLVLETRALTVAMALATLLGVAVLATRLFGTKYTWPAALCAGAFLPFVFYAKTTNVDLPYVFWFVWSLVFLVAFDRRGRWEDAVGLGITAAAAVGTKDQAYGLYVLPAIVLLWRYGRSARGLARLAAAGGAAAATLAACYNLPFNYAAVPHHFAFVSGPARTPFRMYPGTVAGQWQLLQATAVALVSSIGVAGVAFLVAGAGAPPSRTARRELVLILLCVVSYYATFIAVAGYVYDRFLLPVVAVLGLCAGLGLRRLIDAPRAAVRLAGMGLMVWMVARAASIDILLVRDSRLTAERWLQTHVRWDERVGVVSQLMYLPDVNEFKVVTMAPRIADTLVTNPDFIVINREFQGRVPVDSDQQAWLTWLESGAAPYEEVFRYKMSVRWLPLRFDARFRDREEDPFTNLDKANPEIVIFRRTDRRATR